MKSANDIVLKLLGILLLTAAILKGWQLLTEPMPNNDIWTNRAFLIFTVEFEIALGIWLLSGLFKTLAWLSTLACFSMFAIITLYKGISGAESCGCFGSIHVNPWITLFAIDIPSILALAVFRQKHKSDTQVELSSTQCHCENHACQECKCHNTGYIVSLASRFKELYKKYATPLPSLPRLATVICFGAIVLAVSTCVLAFNEPAKSTSEYEVLEPETWVGKPLSVCSDIDIGGKFKRNRWLIAFYHHDCPDCVEVITELKQMAKDLIDNKEFLQIAIVEVPPYGPIVPNDGNQITIGKLSDSKEWFIFTPTTILVSDNIVVQFWGDGTPKIEELFANNSIDKSIGYLAVERRL